MCLILFYSGCKSVESKTSNTKKVYEVNLLRELKPESIFGYETWLMIKPEIKNWKIYAGNTNIEGVKFQLGIYDINDNGILSDYGTDILVVTKHNSDFCQYSTLISSSVCVLKKNNVIRIDDFFFNCSININERTIWINKNESNRINPEIHYISKLPDIEIEYIDGQKGKLTETISGNPIRLEFWAPWCVPCMERIHELSNDESDKFETILVLGDGLVKNAKERLEEINNSFDCIVSPSLNKMFNQNGYPYEVIINQNGIIIK